MANAFSKEERVAFEDILEGFEDALILSKNVSVFRSDDQMMERANDTIWRPMPYIAQSFDGTDMTSNFSDSTQLSVPATLGYSKSSPWLMTATQLRDALQEKRLGAAARQKLASDINVAVMDVVCNQATIFVKRSSAASGFDDVAACEAAMNEIGVQSFDRYLSLSTSDYNSMASNLAGRDWVQGKVQSAYEEALIGTVASFNTFKLDYANRQTAAAATGVTINGANQYYTPEATSTATTGETSNVDNRYQNIDVTVSSGTIAEGDAFTIADVYSTHLITKRATGSLKTFRVTDIISGAGGTGTIQISPPIISGDGGTDAELQYQNVDSTPANGAAVTFLNTVTNYVNPFWYRESIELLPGRYAVPSDSGAAVLRATTEQGVDVVWQKQYDINTMQTKFRLDILFGVCLTQPEMSGVMMFSQT